MEIWVKERRRGLRRRNKKALLSVQSALIRNSHCSMAFCLTYPISMVQQASVQTVMMYVCQYMRKRPMLKSHNTSTFPLPQIRKLSDLRKLPGHPDNGVLPLCSRVYLQALHQMAQKLFPDFSIVVMNAFPPLDMLQNENCGSLPISSCFQYNFDPNGKSSSTFGMIAGNRASLNVIVSASKLILGFMTLDLPSLQCPEADLGSWGISSSEPPPLDSVVALIQSLSPFRPVHFDFDLPRNMGLFDALLHESRCGVINHQTWACLMHSAASVFSGNKHGDIILAKLESIYTDSGDHGSSMGAVVFSNIVTSVFPTYIQEVRTAEREFEGIAKLFENYPQVRLILKYDEALSHSIHTASDMFIIPSAFELCGLTQMIAMRNGATGGLNDSVFDVDEDTIPLQSLNGFTFLTPDEQSAGNALERAFNY